MNISKLKSGSYRIRETRKGKTYSVTVDHKPTQAEARALLDDMQRKNPALVSNRSVTFSQAYEGFKETKGSILSPSTLKGYRTAFRGLPAWFTSMNIIDIEQRHIQKVVNDYSVDHSPKTVKNLHCFVSTVLRLYGHDNTSVTLPQAQQGPVYIPSKEDVSRLLKAVHGSKYEVPIRLGMYGLRRSEIMALTLDDLADDNTLTINKALVEGEHGSVLKSTKTTQSTRTIILDPQLADLIRQQGTIYDGSSSRLTMAVTAYEDAAGLPHFSLHKLRHFFASYMHELGFSDKQIQAAGGWSTDMVMKRVYTHAMEMEQAQKKMAEAILSVTPSDPSGSGL